MRMDCLDCRLKRKGYKIDALDVYVTEIVDLLPIRADKIRKETLNDENLMKIVKALEKGDSLKMLGLENHEFTLSEGILLRQDRVVIPNTLRERIALRTHRNYKDERPEQELRLVERDLSGHKKGSGKLRRVQ